MSQQILDHVESNSLKKEIDKFEIGDTVDVHNRILEGNKERTQVFNGVVIARSGSAVVRCLLFVELFQKGDANSPFIPQKLQRSL